MFALTGITHCLVLRKSILLCNWLSSIWISLSVIVYCLIKYQCPLTLLCCLGISITPYLTPWAILQISLIPFFSAINHLCWLQISFLGKALTSKAIKSTKQALNQHITGWHDISTSDSKLLHRIKPYLVIQWYKTHYQVSGLGMSYVISWCSPMQLYPLIKDRKWHQCSSHSFKLLQLFP